MDEKYWDTVALDYDGEIFSSVANDRDDVIVSAIARFSRKNAIACDFGCGVGKCLPILAKSFRHVYGIDISDRLLAQARSNCTGIENITYYKNDLSKTLARLKDIDFALCVNVAIMACSKIRADIFKTISRSLRRQGHLVLVVPSLESALLADYRLLQWNRKAGLSEAEALWEFEDLDDDDNLSLRQGLVDINGVATKHYLKEELIAIFGDLSLEIVTIEKVQYAWDTEFDQPPKWMEEPYPWDWLAILKKV